MSSCPRWKTGSGDGVRVVAGADVKVGDAVGVVAGADVELGGWREELGRI